MARVKRRIKEWIDECHAKYDREISVGGIMKGIFKAPDFTSETRFTVMGYGKDEDGEDIFYRQDDKIILPTKPRKFGIVKYFACAELSPGKTVTGKACIVYTRHPTRLYGEDNETREQVSVKLQPVACE